MENMEMNNVAVEAVETVAEAVAVNWKKVGIYGGLGLGVTGLTVLGIKKGIPWLKDKNEKRKIKKMEKKIAAMGDVEVTVE